MDVFRFAPELFQYRDDVIAELRERGFDWLSHYSAVDPMHDVFGIEVCGIYHEDVAVSILQILIEMYPEWMPQGLWYKDYGREQGWIATVQRDFEPPGQQWDTAE